jgi:hypothetical protein
MLEQVYKNLFTQNLQTIGSDKNSHTFIKQLAKTYQNQQSLILNGVTVESLIAVRTRFILDWFEGELGKSFNCKLFEHHRQLLQEGYFTAYNYWLLGSDVYNTWAQKNAEENEGFLRFQRSKIFKIPPGQYYMNQ